MSEMELIGAGEAEQIENIIRLTVQQLRKNYPAGSAALRAQHAKGHACVSATFQVQNDLPPGLRVGVFSSPGQEYRSWIRFSNAAAAKGPDSPLIGGNMVHGSRGMAVKLTGVTGTRLIPADGSADQDFLMVNHPVFPFANVEDYEVLTSVIAADGKPDRFFARIKKNAKGEVDRTDPVSARAARTFAIVQRIQSTSTSAVPPAFPAYEDPPASPCDSRYFGGSPLLFGEGKAMKISARPRSPVPGESRNMADPDYLRKALQERLTAPDATAAVFDVQIQVRGGTELAGKIPEAIEDASLEWDEKDHPFITVATITIPPQDFESPERQAFCESLVFTPWNGIAEHRPLGGINRLRRAVYEASAKYRHGMTASA